MAIMLAVDILGCTGTTEERASLLHKIIQIAAELKSNMGNMFGFAAIMRALELPQVHINYTEYSFIFLLWRHHGQVICVSVKGRNCLWPCSRSNMCS